MEGLLNKGRSALGYLLRYTSTQPKNEAEVPEKDFGQYGKASLKEASLTREKLARNIVAFNDNQHGLVMTLNDYDLTFQGFIRIHMNLMCPINMSISKRPLSFHEALGREVAEPEEKVRVVSFHLPKGTTKVVHITSETTAQEVIRALLLKFNIKDSPRKFALYEKVLREDNGACNAMRRLADGEYPLPLCLGWTSEGLDNRQFVLQENDTGEILWEAFTIPELENFLENLNREEEEYVDRVKVKYQQLKIEIEHRLQNHREERDKL